MVPGAGALAAAVPGAVPAWLLLLAEHGTFELADVLGYAIDLAEHGHLVLPQVANAIAAASDLFAEHWPTSAELWLVDGAAPAAHSSIRNPTLAAMLRRLVEAGDAASDREGRIEAARVAWSEGFVAEAIDRFVREAHRHSTGGDHAGVLRASDLAAFRPDIEDAATGTFRGATIAKTGPWGQGPVLLQALAILEHQGDDLLDPSTARGIHTIAEALKLALADRDAWYGDGGDVPLGDLLDPAYAAERAALIGERASAEFRPGSPGGREPWRPPLRTEDELRASGHAGPIGEPTLATEKKVAQRADDATGSDLESGSDRETDHLEGRSGPDGALRGDTCHLDVVDRWGNVVAVTPSGGWLQSSPTIPELGFCLGTRLQMMWLDEASPSALRARAPPAHHPHADHRDRGIRARDRHRHSRRRSAGPVAAAGPAADARRRLHGPGGDRRARVPHDVARGVVLAARVDARGPGGGGAGRLRRDRRAAQPGPRGRRGRRLGARAPVGGDLGCGIRRPHVGGEPAGDAGLRRRAMIDSVRSLTVR